MGSRFQKLRLPDHANHCPYPVRIDRSTNDQQKSHPSSARRCCDTANRTPSSQCALYACLPPRLRALRRPQSVAAFRLQEALRTSDPTGRSNRCQLHRATSTKCAVLRPWHFVPQRAPQTEPSEPPSDTTKAPKKRGPTSLERMTGFEPATLTLAR